MSRCLENLGSKTLSTTLYQVDDPSERHPVFPHSHTTVPAASSDPSPFLRTFVAVVAARIRKNRKKCAVIGVLVEDGAESVVAPGLFPYRYSGN